MGHSWHRMEHGIHGLWINTRSWGSEHEVHVTLFQVHPSCNFSVFSNNAQSFQLYLHIISHLVWNISAAISPSLVETPCSSNNIFYLILAEVNFFPISFYYDEIPGSSSATSSQYFCMGGYNDHMTCQDCSDLLRHLVSLAMVFAFHIRSFLITVAKQIGQITSHMSQRTFFLVSLILW